MSSVHSFLCGRWETCLFKNSLVEIPKMNAFICGSQHCYTLQILNILWQSPYYWCFVLMCVVCSSALRYVNLWKCFVLFYCQLCHIPSIHHSFMWQQELVMSASWVFTYLHTPQSRQPVALLHKLGLKYILLNKTLKSVWRLTPAREIKSFDDSSCTRGQGDVKVGRGKWLD